MAGDAVQTARLPSAPVHAVLIGLGSVIGGAALGLVAGVAGWTVVVRLGPSVQFIRRTPR